MTTPHYDKYDPIAGGFRAKLNADLTVDSEGTTGLKGVSLNATGKVVIGTAGQSGFCGVLVKNVPLYPNLGSVAGGVNLAVPIGGKAGDVVDIMTSGEIVDLDTDDFPAGTRFYAKSDGTVTATSTDGPCVGWTVTAGHLIVRVDSGVVIDS
jgi:hypothetical protein